MRGKYKIAFLYGQSSFEIAKLEKARIEEEYSDYPIEIRLVDNERFITTDGSPQIINVVMQAFEGVDFAIVFVGQDNYSHFFKSDDFSKIGKNDMDLFDLFIEKIVGEKRFFSTEKLKRNVKSLMNYSISQNVVFEVGYLWTILSEKRIRFVPVCKEFSQIKRPSDLPDTFFYTDFKRLFDEIVRKILNAPPCNSLLNDETYQCDYNSLFTKEELQDLDSLRKPTKAHFKAIDNLWREQILELNADEARIIFMFERLMFIPYFPQDGSCDRWITELMYNVSDKNMLCYKILKEIKEYFSLHKEPNIDTDNPNKIQEYKNIYDKLSEYKNEIDDSQKVYSPIILFWLNNYIALSARQYYKLNDSKDVKYLNDSITALELCIQTAAKINPNTAALWLGFTYFNLSRCYNLKSEEDKAKRNMVKAYVARKIWLTQNLLEKLPMIIESSFIAEVVFNAREIISIEPNKKEEALKIKEFCIQKSYMLTTPGFENIRIIKDAIEILTEWKNDTRNKRNE